MGSLLGMNSNGGQALTAGSSNTSYYNRLSEIASQQAQTAQSMGLTMSAQGFQSFSKQWSNYAGMNIQGNSFGSAPQVINTPQEVDWLNNYSQGYVPQGVNPGSFFPAPQHVSGGGGFFEDPGGNQLPTPILNPPPGGIQSTLDPAARVGTPGGQPPGNGIWNGGWGTQAGPGVTSWNGGIPDPIGPAMTLTPNIGNTGINLRAESGRFDLGPYTAANPGGELNPLPARFNSGTGESYNPNDLMSLTTPWDFLGQSNIPTARANSSVGETIHGFIDPNSGTPTMFDPSENVAGDVPWRFSNILGGQSW